MGYNLYYYDSVLDAVVMKDKDDNELVIECSKANAQVVFDEPEDEAYLVRLAREEPANYVSYTLKPDGLQGYVDAMIVFNQFVKESVEISWLFLKMWMKYSNGITFEDEVMPIEVPVIKEIPQVEETKEATK